MPELEKVQALDDRSLFLQAYNQSVEYWSPSTDLTQSLGSGPSKGSVRHAAP